MKHTAQTAIEDFEHMFQSLAPYKHRYEVFRDFVTMAACSLHNGIRPDQTREDEYLGIIQSYERNDQLTFPKLLGSLVQALEPEPRDILGLLYMDMEIQNKTAGQFFTPTEISQLMAAISFADLEKTLHHRPFVSVSEPTCGAGGMILALVKQMIDAGHNPMERLWVQCIDVDRLAALMCYVQLSLWNVPAEVIVGNTLTWQHREVWYTPAYYLGSWQIKLATHEVAQQFFVSDPDRLVQDTSIDPETIHTVSLDEADAKPEDQTARPATKPAQLGFEF